MWSQIPLKPRPPSHYAWITFLERILLGYVTCFKIYACTCIVVCFEIIRIAYTLRLRVTFLCMYMYCGLV